MKTRLLSDSFPIACAVDALLKQNGLNSEFSRDKNASVSDPRFCVIAETTMPGMIRALQQIEKTFPKTVAQSKNEVSLA